MKNILALAILTAASLPMAARAAHLDGNSLLAKCGGADAKLCEVYLDGFAAALTEIPLDARPACLPDSVNSVQLKDVLLKFLHNGPEHRDRPAATLIAHAFSKAWPCHR